MSEARILDTRRRIWMATPGWRVYEGLSSMTPPDINNLSEMKDREMQCLSRATPCVNNLSLQEFEIVVPSPKVTESHAMISNTLTKYSREGVPVTFDFDPQFIYGGGGIGTVRYKTYLNFISLPQYLGQALLTFLNFSCGHYIYLLHVDGMQWMFYYSDNSLVLTNAGRNEFMDVSIEIERWGLI